MGYLKREMAGPWRTSVHDLSPWRGRKPIKTARIIAWLLHFYASLFNLYCIIYRPIYSSTSDIGIFIPWHRQLHSPGPVAIWPWVSCQTNWTTNSLVSCSFLWSITHVYICSKQEVSTSWTFCRFFRLSPEDEPILELFWVHYELFALVFCFLRCWSQSTQSKLVLKLMQTLCWTQCCIFNAVLAEGLIKYLCLSHSSNVVLTLAE